jgi:hypothetical protein
MKKTILILFFSISLYSSAQTVLNANGPGNTYELINSVLAPTGGDVVENPECVHPEFGRHIVEVWDNVLNQYVFEFYIHVTPDNDRCINFDRQRLEIKTYDASPASLKGNIGETIEYKWKFRVPVGFQPSSSFTHLHQIKAVGGDDDDPIFTLTARKGIPNKMELNYYVSSVLSSEKLTSVNLSLFEGNWVEVTERIKVDITNGTYSISIKNIATGATILSYSNPSILTFRPDNTFIRPKWGIYRSLNTPADLRDEAMRFNGFSIQENPPTTLVNAVSQNSKVDIFPTKTKGQYEFNCSLNEPTKLHLELYNLKGVKYKIAFDTLDCEPGKFNKILDFSQLPKQTYLLKISGLSEVVTRKLLLE